MLLVSELSDSFPYSERPRQPRLSVQPRPQDAPTVQENTTIPGMSTLRSSAQRGHGEEPRQKLCCLLCVGRGGHSGRSANTP